MKLSPHLTIKTLAQKNSQFHGKKSKSGSNDFATQVAN